MKLFNFVFLCVLSTVIFLSCSDTFKSTLEVRNENSSPDYSDTITDIMISEGQEESYKSVWSGTLNSGDNVLVEIDSGDWCVKVKGRREYTSGIKEDIDEIANYKNPAEFRNADTVTFIFDGNGLYKQK